MAINWEIFKKRALTALVFVAVMLAGLLWNPWSFFILFTIIHFGCWWEFLRLLEKIHQTVFHPYTKLGYMMAGYGLMLLLAGPDFQVGGYILRDNISLPVSAAGFALLIIGLFQKNAVSIKPMSAALLGIPYISLSWGLMLTFIDPAFKSHFPGKIYESSVPWIPIVVICAIWINDTMAYVVGSLIGKTPLSKISPKKTWEGTLGGILLSVLVTGLLSTLVFKLEHRYYLYAIPLVAAATGTLGDLLESKLKRMAGVKDSGAIMPGHGGFLDRFDSLLLATFFVWLFVTLVIS